LPRDRSVADEELARHPFDVADRLADEVALHHGAQSGREDARREEARRAALLQAECVVESRLGIGDRAGLGIELVEERAAFLGRAQREEQDSGKPFDLTARTAQVANPLAAERSAEMAQEDEQAHAVPELLAQRAAGERDARNRTVEHIRRRSIAAR